eukprot:TRINITY_DN8855_c0_g1_i1.p2 TRINITY_DN8855_c0_g1~~TRINITY_DN8855_c0_g1_i1.p2  ORF type:complete len:108 (-),score=18.61 TRINITY_DN8855_c0_g1_i1:281-562(-)
MPGCQEILAMRLRSGVLQEEVSILRPRRNMLLFVCSRRSVHINKYVFNYVCVCVCTAFAACKGEVPPRTWKESSAWMCATKLHEPQEKSSTCQ